MPTIDTSQLATLYIACDAGMGSSAMLASTLKKQLKKTDVVVTHVPVHKLPADAVLVVCHKSLADLAQQNAPGAIVVPFQLFLGDPAVSRVVEAIKSGAVING